MSSRADEMLRGYENDLTFEISLEGKPARVPIYKFMEKFLKITDKEGNLIPFILNESQIELYKEICKQKRAGRGIRANILKARQLGFSTFIAGLIFVSTIFRKGQTAGIIADTAEHASNLFEKYKTFYDYLPEEIKGELPKEKSNAKELFVTYRDKRKSGIKIMVEGDNAGRSGTFQLLHFSECAFWSQFKKTMTSIMQTVGSNPNSMVFLETTANGMNEYKERWDRDYGGNTPFIPVFFAWYQNSDYKVEDRFLTNYNVPEWLVEIKENYNLSDNQCQWYYEKYEELEGDLDLLRQEYPSNPVEAFITSGNSVFNVELLRKRKEEIINLKPLHKGFFTFTSHFSQDGKRITITNTKFIESRSGSIKIYTEPELGHPYVAVNDPANGGEDYFATQVVDNYTGKQVAVYHKNKVDIDDAAYQMYCLATYYNNALVSGETNTTSYLLEMVHKMGYRFIYQDQDVEDLSGRFMNKFGYKTKTNNRQYMIDLFKVAFRENPNIISDYETLCEMEAFQVIKHSNGKEKVEASGDSHDDLVMAMCGFYLCRGAQTSIVNLRAKPKASTLEELEEAVTRNRKEIDSGNERRMFQIWD